MKSNATPPRHGKPHNAKRIGPIHCADPSRIGPVPMDREVAHVVCLRCGNEPAVLRASADDDWQPSISAECCGERLNVNIPDRAIIDGVVEGVLAMGAPWTREQDGLVHVVDARLGDFDVTRCGRQIVVDDPTDVVTVPKSRVTASGSCLYCPAGRAMAK
jgi:hypothetical protein